MTNDKKPEFTDEELDRFEESLRYTNDRGIYVSLNTEGRRMLFALAELRERRNPGHAARHAQEAKEAEEQFRAWIAAGASADEGGDPK